MNQSKCFAKKLKIIAKDCFVGFMVKKCKKNRPILIVDLLNILVIWKPGLNVVAQFSAPAIKHKLDLILAFNHSVNL